MKKLYEESSVQAIADAIRSKTNKTDKMTVGEMSGEVDGIDLDAAYQSIIDGTIEELVSDKITQIPGYLLQGSAVRKISLPKMRTIDNICEFRKLNSLEEVYLPELVSMASYNFMSCPNLKDSVFPKLETINTYCFSSSQFTNQITLDFPRLKEMKGDCVFYEAGQYLKAMILRRSDQVCTLDGNYIFGGYSTGNKIYIYVPKALMDQYNTDTIWSRWFNTYKSFVLRALEDYTVDGTTTGALDESKI